MEEVTIITKAQSELSEFENLVEEIDKLATRCHHFVVSSETIDDAKVLAKDSKKITNWIEDVRKKVTKPILDEKKRIDDYAKKLSNDLNKATEKLRNQILNYEMELEKERQRQMKLIREEEERKRKELESVESPILKDFLQDEIKQEIQTLVEEVPDKPKSLRSNWKYELVDIKQVPLRYLTLNDALIKEAIREGERDIAGIRIYDEPILHLR